MQLQEINCPNCGAKIDISGYPEYVTCAYCDSRIATGFKRKSEHQTNTSHSERTADTQNHKHTYQESNAQNRQSSDDLSGMFSFSDPVNRWRFCGFVWILVVVVLMWIFMINESGGLAIFWLLWIIFGIIFILVARNVSGRASRPDVRPPLYARWGFIIFIGIITAGIYWVIGTFLRWLWKYKNHY